MSNSFCGWRRKTGSTLLVISLALMSAWLRSGRIDDSARFTVFGRRQLIVSWRGDVEWWGWNTRDGDWDSPYLNSVVLPPPSSQRTHGLFNGAPRNNPHIDLFSALCDDDEGLRHVAHFRSRYWTIVWPLTFLSAYLILWPGKRTNARNETQFDRSHVPDSS